MTKILLSDTVVTFYELSHYTDEVANAVIPLCETDTHGIEDWLSAAATDYTGTIADLAAEWDALNN